MTHDTIKIACDIYGAQAVLEAAQQRIIWKDHNAFKKIGLPDPSTLVEAFGVMDVAILHLTPHHSDK